MGFFRKHGHSSTDAMPPPSNIPASTSPEVTLQPDAGCEFTEKDVNFSSLFMPFVKNYVANLAHNKSPNKLPYPPCFYYPASSLQHQMNLQMHHIDLLATAASLPTPVERFLAVLKYTLSTCSLTKFPYKPIIAFLGETAQTYITHTDGQTSSTTHYIGEQVEKEPPSNAFYICNPTKGFVHEGSVAMVPKFKQAHVHVSFTGQRRTVLTHPQGLFNETYFADVPDLNIRLLRMHTELGGAINLTSTTGYAANVQFKDKPIFGGQKNAISGSVTFQGQLLYLIDGTWDETIYLVDVHTKERHEFFSKMYPKQKVESYPLDVQPETSGEKVWGPLIETLHKRDFEQAKVLKAELDAQGHERLAQFEQQGGFEASFFHKNATGGWDINDPSSIGMQGGKPTM